MRSGSTHPVDHSNPTHFISKPTIGRGFGLFERKDGGGWAEVEGRQFFDRQSELVAALKRGGFVIRGRAAWEPTPEQKALADIRGIIGRMRWDAKPGYLLPEEAINLIREVLSREMRHG